MLEQAMTLDTGTQIPGRFSSAPDFVMKALRTKFVLSDALSETFSSRPARNNASVPKVPGWLRSLRNDTQNGSTALSQKEAVITALSGVMRSIGDVAKIVTEDFFAAIGLLVLLPLFLIVALAIKLDSQGPVFFSQSRTGKNGRVFKILKFRTMTAQSGAEVKQATQNDMRVTRVGRILRKTSIDELPQLINVLKGDMALVGPRPHAIQHDNYYSTVVANYKKRFAVRPGLTGWAQVNSLRGETETVEKMQKRVDCDLEYINHMSYRLDILIIFMTPMVLLFHKNAY